VIDVLLATVTPVAAVPPKVTVAPATKPVPVMVIPVAPSGVPLLGVTELTVGAGAEPEISIWTKFATEGTPLVLTTKSM
jgi:hypothetical protein